MSDTHDDRVKQLVEFLDPLVDDSFKIKFNELSKYSKEELKQHTQKLEDWALALGVAEQKQLQTGRLLGIISDFNEFNCENTNHHQQQQNHQNQQQQQQQPNGIFENNI
ncbi:hypothetical protein DDB_G0274333 [Dictyostelium discoideum AX4]|uniref:Putative uncharacterized protein DDB_G0274333 n=1 Tax=Dictyostelium discoideum TaxID=44689 RepID=Y7891_DICDI|nr:hypothetical protein DDB_G0274333 [Dictyostelium discoideum AX4]Q86IY1.1 RecName: Full=Putative uncharacterized protein DDB_G0274333 [Dictyostelium discoideum]EAL70059.1 hypothetical protein DDB_G0274333 [Dictyostelium discoideum AX4]|eukprot:XP_643920.1 hypothetical protein DDB_G0274333 [Dictyostelium discoideum AX4]